MMKASKEGIRLKNVQMKSSGSLSKRVASNILLFFHSNTSKQHLAKLTFPSRVVSTYSARFNNGFLTFQSMLDT
jgi:hypothetical protein